MIYFDNAATTAVDPQVLTTYQEVTKKIWGNPSSLHRMGTQATRILEASRQQIADLLGKSPEEIFFTSGGTEADNWAIKGIAFEKAYLGKHVLVSAIEHPAVLEAATWLESQGFEVERIPVDDKGYVRVDLLEEMIRPETILVSMMAVNNEIGTIQPVQQVSRVLADKPTISFHVDAVQAIGKVALSDFLTDRVDFASFSGHKFHGVRGVGMLFVKKGKKISPLLHGGGQESDLRSTTENVAGIAAMAKALRLTLERFEEKQAHLAVLKEAVLVALQEYPDITVFSQREAAVPNIVTFGIKNIRGEVIVHAFEEHEIFLSTTSACSSKAGKPAGTLLAMGVPQKLAQTAVRISFDDGNTMAEMEQFLTTLNLIYANTQKVR